MGRSPSHDPHRVRYVVDPPFEALPKNPGGVVPKGRTITFNHPEFLVSKKTMEKAAELGITPEEFLASELVREYRKGRPTE